MRKNKTFILIIFLIFGTISLFAEETTILSSEAVQPTQENISRLSWNNFINGFVNVYKTIENGVVTSYKAVENVIVNAYKTIENWFTKTFNIPVSRQSSQTVNPTIETATEGDKLKRNLIIITN